ncbi:Hypothetical predicted protein [Cloeon dipterum]|uniref:RGS domain-containing protein n=1 Tax=Cloeon dipterum TaxID=197152 RepID=A0A8S1E5I8_9INSE|nr:Hypothetical predicted protein [Cloeon dipterum]
MTQLCLLIFSICLYAASITCTEGSQTGTDEKSSRGEPLNGISNDVLAKLNSDQDLERFYHDASCRPCLNLDFYSFHNLVTHQGSIRSIAKRAFSVDMTRLCLLIFSVCLFAASITCTEGSQTGTDEKSSRGEPLKGISNDVLAKLNSDLDLERKRTALQSSLGAEIDGYCLESRRLFAPQSCDSLLKLCCKESIFIDMTRLCLLAFSVCLHVASITCSDGAIAPPQKGTDEKSSRGEALEGISDNVLAKLNSNKDLERVWQQDAFQRNVLSLDSSQEKLAKFINKEFKPYPALLKRLKNIAEILSSDPFFVKIWELFINPNKESSISQADFELFLQKEMLSKSAFMRKLMDITSKAMENDPDLNKLWKNAVDKGFSENSSPEEWKHFLTDVTDPALGAKLQEFIEISLRSVETVFMVFAAFADDYKTNGPNGAN